jgi:hypothetical protein
MDKRKWEALGLPNNVLRTVRVYDPDSVHGDSIWAACVAMLERRAGEEEWGVFLLSL